MLPNFRNYLGRNIGRDQGVNVRETKTIFSVVDERVKQKFRTIKRNLEKVVDS